MDQLPLTAQIQHCRNMLAEEKRHYSQALLIEKNMEKAQEIKLRITSLQIQLDKLLNNHKTT